MGGLQAESTLTKGGYTTGMRWELWLSRDGLQHPSMWVTSWPWAELELELDLFPLADVQP